MAILEGISESLDIGFLFTLFETRPDLAWASVTCLVLTLLGRIAIVRNLYNKADPKKLGTFYCGAAVFVLEPNSGMRDCRLGCVCYRDFHRCVRGLESR